MVRGGHRGPAINRPRQLPLPPSGMSADVQAALTRVQAKLEAIPESERQARERRYQALEHALGRGRH